MPFREARPAIRRERKEEREGEGKRDVIFSQGGGEQGQVLSEMFTAKSDRVLRS